MQIHIGTENYPEKPLEAQFDDKLGIGGYLTLFEHATETLGRNQYGESRNPLSLTEYAEGSTIFIVNCEPNEVSHSVFAVKVGSSACFSDQTKKMFENFKPNNQAISVSLKFGTPLSTTTATNLYYMP